MEMNLFFKKVYTAAFRLTGDKNIASEMAFVAINNTLAELDMDSLVTVNMYKSTILELVKIFLQEPIICYNIDNYINPQSAFLKLKPLSRVTVVWKDVLGFQISDNMPVVNHTREELLKELICGRRELKDLLVKNYYYKEVNKCSFI